MLLFRVRRAALSSSKGARVTLEERTTEVCNRVLEVLRALGIEHRDEDDWIGNELIFGAAAALWGVCQHYEVDPHEALTAICDAKIIKVEDGRAKA
jgi:hypothetical protein